MSHECPIRGCKAAVPAHMLMDARHWRMVPKPLQRAVWTAWGNGAGAGSAAHEAAIDAAIQAVDRKVAAADLADPAIDPAILRDLLLLVSVDAPMAVIGQWSPQQQVQARDWAAREHLHASDNPVKRVPMPAFLAACLTGEPK